MLRELKPCGTEAAARRHARYGEPLCDACREAQLVAQRRRKGHQPRGIVRCGTISGYSRHRKLRETPCDECRAEWARYCRERGAARRAAGKAANR
jgi:hypothetical protein